MILPGFCWAAAVLRFAAYLNYFRDSITDNPLDCSHSIKLDLTSLSLMSCFHSLMSNLRSQGKASGRVTNVRSMINTSNKAVIHFPVFFCDLLLLRSLFKFCEQGAEKLWWRSQILLPAKSELLVLKFSAESSTANSD
jgi:hypothetical protein